MTYRSAEGVIEGRLGEGIDGVPLALAPLPAALLGAIAGNAAMFFGYVEWLTRCRDLPWNAAMMVSVFLGVVSLPFSSRPGAGGSARRGLRLFTMMGLVLGSLGVLRMFTP